MRSYRSVERTALDLLYKAGLVEIVGKEPLVLEKEVVVYGMSFGEEIPKVCLEYANLFSILLSHEPILTPKQLQKDEVFCSTVRKINREKGKIFDLFINGDWHYPYCNSRCEGGLAVSTTKTDPEVTDVPVFPFASFPVKKKVPILFPAFASTIK